MANCSDFAQREPGILATRGESISSAVPEHVFGWDGDYDDLTSLDGTSMAAPQAAGASMLIRQSLIEQGIEPTAEAILDRLHESARQRRRCRDRRDVRHDRSERRPSPRIAATLTSKTKRRHRK